MGKAIGQMFVLDLKVNGSSTVERTIGVGTTEFTSTLKGAFARVSWRYE